MPEQLELPGFGPAPERRPRRRAQARPEGPNTVFLAVPLPAQMLATVGATRSRLVRLEGLSGREIGPDRLHITLHDLGGFDEPSTDFIDALAFIAAAISTPPFEVMFDQAQSFPRPLGDPPLVLSSSGELAGLAALRRELGLALANAGIWHQETRTPHMTLLYDSRAVRKQAIEPVTWIATEFVLVKSLVGKSVHKRLGAWPLVDR